MLVGPLAYVERRVPTPSYTFVQAEPPVLPIRSCYTPTYILLLHFLTAFRVPGTYSNTLKDRLGPQDVNCASRWHHNIGLC
jgi:hypothetical protein